MKIAALVSVGLVASAHGKSAVPSTVSTLSPAVFPSGNLTCNVLGDPHVRCFSDALIQVLPEESNSWFTVYDMPERLLAVGDLPQQQVGQASVRLATQLYVEYNGQPQALVNYTEDCRPMYPDPQPTLLRMAAPPVYGGELYFEWHNLSTEVSEYLILSWTCPTDAQGAPAGMKITVNKRDSNVPGDRLAWELAQGYTGVCTVCSANQPYYGPIPGQRGAMPNAFALMNASD